MDSVYRLQVLRFIHLWHKGLPPDVLDKIFQHASNIHGYNTRYSAERNPHKSKVRTDIGKQSRFFAAIDIWKDLPSSLKDASVFAFLKQVKYSLSSKLLLLLFFFIFYELTSF